MVAFKIKTFAVAAFAALLMALCCAVPAYAWTEHDNIIAEGHGWFQPSHLVIHSTANEGATAWNHVQYWASQGNEALMPQWVADWTDGGTVYQVASGNAVTWHVGNGNWSAVGLEICEATNEHDFEIGFDTAAQWAATYLDEQGWGVDRMVSHNEARYIWGGTDHVDPIPYFEKWGRSWADFESLVQWYLDNPDAMTYGEEGGGSGSAGSGAVSQPSSGSVADAAYGVMMGWYGNMPEREANLAAAGYDYAEVQAYVNSVYYGIGSASQPSSGSVADAAYGVMMGWYGNGQDRVDALTAAGYDYWEVQSYVNSVYYGM